MNRPHSHLIALYDATSEHTKLVHASLGADARALGKALARANLGAIARIGTPAIYSILSAVAEEGSSAIALSPAANKYEHENAFRLPEATMPIVYTGRGALGADVAALASSDGVLIVGASEEELDGILGCIGSGEKPIAILTDEPAVPLRERLVTRYPWALHALHISSDPVHSAQTLSEELRKKHLNAQHAK